jgi:hypothetical protein
MTRAATPDQQADHDRADRRAAWRPGDAPSLDQRAAVAKLVGYAEAVAGSGLLGDLMEVKLRERIAETLIAFNMRSLAEQEPA